MPEAVGAGAAMVVRPVDAVGLEVDVGWEEDALLLLPETQYASPRSN